MESPKALSNAAEGPQSLSSANPAIPFRGITPIEMRPVFALTFPIGTSMRDILDSVFRSALQYTHGNRIAAAELLHINPRTIFRHLGRKATTSAVQQSG
jgi:DNA-binding NtrC family response regulator